ncbi:zinc-binding alcohol dehydrogenase family protein [Alsobacter sp. SYSU M60028]|uniref:Zinc-binding alcohol dehydrogenase family protein n=1 Tax=Alsobacter ponti TaxID=2962936 RepID=A0ABT1L7L9_9HYPH|nr:zinc-binding alcohol dehydrogenase family protein [Alsobacter ponti]MCP8937417.1 zinc-binding alcohol dehydrogenase family protein [Alsobacter ponti]
MRALMIEAVGRTVFHDVPEPAPGPGEVLLAVRHIGLCGSDLATFSGLNPLVALPRIPGHELGCEIVSAGEGVPPDYAPGRRAIVMPYTACGQCTSCRQGRVNACRYNRTLGVQQDGGLAERIVAPFGKLILNDRLQPRHMALVEPLSVGFHAIARGRVTARDRVVVLGCGMIGMGAIAGAAARGASVIAVDVSAGKFDCARRWGAAHTIDASQEDVAARVNELTSGDGADVVVEAVGLPATFRQSIDLVCFSGRVVYIGYSKSEVAYDTKFFNLKELDIMGSRNATVDDFRAVIAFLEAPERNPDDLITKVFPFDRAEEALPFWLRERADVLKVMVER